MKPTDRHILRDGTGQNQRMAKALRTDYIQLEERSLADFLRYAEKISKELKYFNLQNVEEGDWSEFITQGVVDLELIEKLEDYVAQFPEEKIPPHLAMFLGFLKLMEFPRTQLNKLTDRHLDFFYSEVLGLQKRRPSPDKTHVIVGLDETATNYLLKKDTLFKAGEDENGKQITFRSEGDVFINNAKVSALKNNFVYQEISNVERILQLERDTETAFNKILQLIYGEEEPGGDLAPFVGQTVDYKFFVDYTTVQDNTSAEKEVLNYARRNRPKGLNVAEYLNELFLGYFFFNKNIFDAMRASLAEKNIRVLLPYFENAYIKRIYHMREMALFDYYQQLNKKYEEQEAKNKLINYIWGEPNAGDYLPEFRGSLPDLFKFGKRNTKDKTTLILSAGEEQYVKDSLLLSAENFQHVINYLSGLSADKELCFSILEVAQREKRNVPVPEPSYSRLKEVFYSPDPKQLKVEFYPDFDEAYRWKTFGKQDDSDENKYIEKALAGFAISSPVLELTEGVRKIIVTFDIVQGKAWEQLGKIIKSHTRSPLSEIAQSEDAPSELILPFRFYLSGEEGMFEVEAKMSCLASGQLKCEILLAETAPKVVPLPKEFHNEADVVNLWPVLRMVLSPFYSKVRGKEYFYYQWFKSILVKQVRVDVEVQDIKKVLLQNDDSTIDPAKPFEPFGSSPSRGFGFYVSHQELYYKTIDSLKLHFDWLDLPDNFITHYENYGFPKWDGKKYETFKVAATLHDESLVAKSFGQKPLLKDRENKQGSLKYVAQNELEVKGIDGFQKIVERDNGSEEVLEQNRYLKLELQQPTFQHAEYAGVSLYVSTEMSKKFAGLDSDPAITNYVVNAPYTPKLKSISCSYKANALIHPEDQENDQDRVFHLYSHGFRQVEPQDIKHKSTEESGYELHVDVLTEEDSTDSQQKFHLLPQFENEGELYIGLNGVTASQNVSVLFQMAEGSADPDIAPPQVTWWYLSKDIWKSFDDGHLLSDETNGLIQTGIITFNIPSDASNDNTLLEAGKHWIKASVEGGTRGLCDTIDIITQAVSLERVISGNNPFSALPAESVTEPSPTIPQVKTIRQPFNSYSGSLPETQEHFKLRVSERLRHKDRAISVWDYERLVLEKFPDIYKVKCLTARASGAETLVPSNPGQVTVIVVPDIRNKIPFNPFEPKVSAGQLFEIQQYLEQHTSAWAETIVRNPRYIQLKLKVFVRFRQGYTEGFYRKKLNNDLVKFLAPWAFDNSAEIVFGNKVHAGSIINFIDKREYVDFVGQLRVFQKNNKNYFEEIKLNETNNEMQVDMEDAIIVSAKEHHVHVITDDAYNEQQYTGIDFMRLELDFTLN